MVKRFFDIVIAVVAVCILAVPIVGIAIVIRIRLGSPVFFCQHRIGRLGSRFKVVKFRTMRDVTDKDGNSLPDQDRLTPFGIFLRSTSLDELPELWNIIRGEMSFVGPRPLLPEYVPYYLPEQMRRHEVRPGLTGLAQISGRNDQSWDQRFEFDVRYVDNHSFWGDLKILVLTAARVLAREGVSAEGHETMPRFDDQVRAGLAKGNSPSGTPK
jgi:lipopolysaccharide/colanic/teichoic acid biosynthesis glycosyltransferase